MTLTAEERFWAKVEVLAENDCWLWTATSANGYGWFYIGGGRENSKSTTAHRFSFYLAHGWWPEQVDHRDHCNTLCVNPNHLRAATNKQNGENRQGPTSRSKSGVRGVDWHAGNKKWRGTVGHLGKQITVGYFDDLEEAEAAVVAKRIELFTHNSEDRKTAC